MRNEKKIELRILWGIVGGSLFSILIWLVQATLYVTSSSRHPSLLDIGFWWDRIFEWGLRGYLDEFTFGFIISQLVVYSIQERR